MEPVPVLVAVSGALAGRSYVITEAGLRMGRDAENEIVVDEAGTSRQHARVILHNGAIWVQDAGSRNGVFVNGERVPDHRQLKPGDRVQVSQSVFEVQLSLPSMASLPPQPAPVPPPPRPLAPVHIDPPEEPRKSGWKLWPFAVALLLTAGCIGCIGMIGWLHPTDEPATGASGQGPSYSLTAVIPADGSAPAAPGPATPAPSVADALAIAAGADQPSPAAPGVPAPPPGSTAAELTERGHALYETGRINEARVAYQQALVLDPNCQICTVRVERLQAEIAEKAQAQLDAGLRYWDSMQVQQAIAAWETVLLLVPDPADPINQRASESLARARGGSVGGAAAHTP